jgi:tetratricopeptide (TPR) repeat protein
MLIRPEGIRMRISVLETAAAALVCLAALATPATAQTLEQHLAHCNNRDGQFAPALVISGCTAHIDSGRLDNRNLATVLFNRGNGYFDQRDYPRAIADYSEVIRLNPRFANAYANRALAYEELGDHARAAADRANATRPAATSQ